MNIANPVVRQEIRELDEKIGLYHQGLMDEDTFRSTRLTRGIYGQRQKGVQMVRIKLPLGKISPKQLTVIARISDRYSTGRLHLTTRQDIQLHYVGLDETVSLWTELAEADMTLREACGNTVRNVTASPMAGIDPDEPFDVTPYAEAVTAYLLRNTVTQDLGRKFKIAFSSSEKDTAYAFIHDVGLIPKVRIEDGQFIRGFKVIIGGGLGAQPFAAQVAKEFLDIDQLIPFIEAVIRVFDRYGERTNRHKARLKYLLHQVGLEAVLKMVEEEWIALPYKSIPIDGDAEIAAHLPVLEILPTAAQSEARETFDLWKRTNALLQKQSGYYAVQIKVPLGDIYSNTARALATVTERYSADDLRITVNQNLLLRFVAEGELPKLFEDLKSIGLMESGAERLGDITACPGTDTCNLGISNSTGISVVLEELINREYPDLIEEKGFSIKISGCMNSCGQHVIASIGFHGSSLKHGARVVPALQLMLGGATLGDGTGRFADHLLKVPSKRVPAVLRAILDDFKSGRIPGEPFHTYYERQGRRYFQQLLKPLTDLKTLEESDYADWGQEEQYVQAIGVGECANISVDLVATLLNGAREKLSWAQEAIQDKRFADTIYHSYSVFIQSAKALLISQGIGCNSQHSILVEFDRHFGETVPFVKALIFRDFVLRINKNEPSELFADQYMNEAKLFVQFVETTRANQLSEAITHPIEQEVSV